MDTREMVVSFVGVIGIAGLLWYMVAKEHGRAQAREQRATERGWSTPRVERSDWSTPCRALKAAHSGRWRPFKGEEPLEAQRLEDRRRPSYGGCGLHRLEKLGGVFSRTRWATNLASRASACS